MKHKFSFSKVFILIGIQKEAWMRSASKILFFPLILQLVLPAFVSAVTCRMAYAQEIPTDDPSFKERKVEEGFTLNLKELIERSKKKIEQVDDKLKEQARFRRNQQREAKAREYFDKATELYERGDFDKARDLWEKAIKITDHDEMEDYIGESVHRQKEQERALRQAEKRRIKRLEKERGYSAKEVNKKYKDAVKFYRSEKYLAAKVAFEEVESMFPGHKATQSYLALINDKIDSQQQKLIEEKLRNDTYTSAKAKARWKKELEEQEKARQKEIRSKADELYQQAVELYKDQQFKAAKEKFKEVEWMLPDYKNTIKYLARIDGDIKKNGVTFSQEDRVKFFKQEYKRIRERDDWAEQNKIDPKMAREFSEDRRRREEAAFVYDAALTLYKKDYYKQALEKFYEVQALYPDFKKTQSYIRKLHKKVPGSENEFTRMQAHAKESATKLFSPAPGVNEQVVRAVNGEEQKRIELAEEKYRQALAFYQDRNFVEAQRKFIAVESILPGYKATRDYLKNIDGDMAGQHVQAGEDKSSGGFFGLFGGGDKESYRKKYRMAKDHFAKKQWEQAKDLFEEVNHLKPGYRGTEKYLARIADKLESPAAPESQRPAPESDTGSRKIAKKVEPIPGMNSGVPKSYPKASEPAASAEKVMPNPVSAQPAQTIAMQRTAPATDAEPLTKPLSDVELKELERNRKKLEKMQQRAEGQDMLTDLERKTLDGNRKSIDKEIARQQKESIRKLQDVVGETYKEAVGLYKLEQYAAAKAKFATVEGVKPGYKRAAEYMRKADEKLNAIYESESEPDAVTPQKAVPEVKDKAQAKPTPPAKDAAPATKPAPAVTTAQIQPESREKTLEELAVEIDDDYYHPMSDVTYSRKMSESMQRQAEETQQAYAARLERLAALQKKEGEVHDSIAELSEKDLKEKYQLAKRLYHAKNYQKAKTVFAQISERQADYKGTARYIHKIDIILDRQQVQREEYRQQMAQASGSGPRAGGEAQPGTSSQAQVAVPAKTAEDKAIEKKTQQYFSGRQAERWTPLKPPSGGPAVSVPDVDDSPPEYAKLLVKDLYREGKKLYGQKDYAEARSFFARVEQMQPDYKRTRDYLQRIQKSVSLHEPAPSGLTQMADQGYTPPMMPGAGGDGQRQAAAEYRKLTKEQRKLEAEQKRDARKARLTRTNQDDMLRDEDRNIYAELLAAQQQDQQQLRLEQDKARREKELRAREEEKQRERDEREAKLALKEKLKDQLMEARQQALDFLENNEEAQAQLFINKFDELLTHSGFSAKEQRRYEKDFERRRKKITKRLEKMRTKEENSILAKTNLSREEKNKLTIKQQRELEMLEERIQTEQRKLAQAREEEQKRLDKVAQAKQSTAAADPVPPKDRMNAVSQALDNVNLAKVKAADMETLAELEKQKKAEIEELVKERQKEIQEKRKRVQKEFERSLRDMYKKGVRLYKKRGYQQSAEIFREIQRMRPGYKKVDDYLGKIDEALLEERAAQFQAQRNFHSPALSSSGAKVALPPQKEDKKVNRLQSIKNALDDFEEKMW